MHHAVRLAVLAAVALQSSGPANAALDAKTDREVAGVFSNACGERSQVMIRLYGDVLDVERGGKAVNANRLQVARTPPPGAPVADFKAIVNGQVKGGRDSIALTLTHSAKGLFARIDGSDKALAPLGSGVVGQTIRHCDPNRNALPGAPPRAAEVGPTALLADPKFKALYLKALGPLARERWLARLDGPAPTNKKAKVAGQEYTLAAACKPHDCADNNIVLLYSATQGVVYAQVHLRGRDVALGGPTPQIAAEMAQLWKKEWRR
jgi:hypothetical protein